MRGIADLRCVQPAVSPAPTLPLDGLHPGDPLGVEPVRATVVERDRAVGQAPQALQRRRGDLDELTQAGCRRRQLLPGTLEQHELAGLRVGCLGVGRYRGHRLGGTVEAVDPENDTRRAALHLDRARRPRDVRRP